MKRALTILFLSFTVVSFTQPVRYSASPDYAYYAENMATTVMNLWKDSFALDGKPAKWSYDMGVILKGMEGLWMNTGNPGYYEYIQKHIDFFVKDDGSIKTYKQDEFNIDNINNGKLLLLLYRVTLKDKYL